MDFFSLLPSLLGVYAAQVPLFLVFLIGIGLAFVRWQDQRKRATITLVVCILSILDLLIGTFISIALPFSMQSDNGMSASQLSLVLGVISAARNILHTGMWAAILFAIFGWRQPAAPAEPAAEPAQPAQPAQF